MSITKIWNLHLHHDGPVTEEFLAGTKQLAESIADEPGTIRKIRAVEEGTNHYGSTYLFRKREHPETHKAVHVKRLEAIGITVTSDQIFDIMEDASTINNAPLQG